MPVLLPTDTDVAGADDVTSSVCKVPVVTEADEVPSCVCEVTRRLGLVVTTLDSPFSGACAVSLGAYFERKCLEFNRISNIVFVESW